MNHWPPKYECRKAIVAAKDGTYYWVITDNYAAIQVVWKEKIDRRISFLGPLPVIDAYRHSKEPSPSLVSFLTDFRLP